MVAIICYIYTVGPSDQAGSHAATKLPWC